MMAKPSRSARAALLTTLLLAVPLAVAEHPDGNGHEPLGGRTVPAQPPLLVLAAEAFEDRPLGRLVDDPQAEGGTAWALEDYGMIATTVDVPSTGVVWVEVRVRGEHDEGLMNPHVHPVVDGEQRGEADVTGGWISYRQPIPMLAGERRLAVDNFNNYHRDAPPRTLVVDWVRVERPTTEGAPRVGADGPVTVDGPDVHMAGTGRAVGDETARGGKMWLMWGVGCFAEAVVLEESMELRASARLRGDEQNGVGSRVTVRWDGEEVDRYHVGDAWEDRATTVRGARGAHVVEWCYDNDYGGDEKRNLRLDEMTFERLAAWDAPPGDEPPEPAPVERRAWTSAHGSLANVRAAPSALTPATASTVERLWRYEASGSVTGTPVHEGGVAYFGDWGGRVHAVDLATGARVWRVDHGAGVDSSLALDGERLLVADAEGFLTARDRATGEVVWRVRADETEGTHLYGSPVVHGGRVYLGVASQQTLVEYEGPQDFRGSVAAFDAGTGELLWRTRTTTEGRGVAVWSTPAVDPELGLLFVGTGNAYAEPAGALSDAIVALRLEDGALAWSFQATRDDVFDGRGRMGPDRDFGASPLLFEAGGRKLVGDGDKGGRFFALDRATGGLVWRAEVDFQVPGSAAPENEGFLGTAAYRDGLLFAPTTDRSVVHALDAATGEVRWTHELNPPPRGYGERMFGAATVTDGGVVVQGSAYGWVHLLDAATGGLLANLSVGHDVQGGASLAGDLVLVPDAGGSLWDEAGGVTAFRATAEAAPPPPAGDDGPPAHDEPAPDEAPPIDDGADDEDPPVDEAGPPPDGLPVVDTPGPGALALALLTLAAAALRRRRARP